MLDNEFVQQSFERFAKAVVKQAKSNLTRGKHRTTGELYKSLDNWKVRVGRGGSVSLVFEMPDYAAYQDRGVKGADNSKSHRMREFTPYRYTSKMPPLKEIQKWVSTRRFQFRDRQSGRFKSYEQTARTIQRSIYQKGIPQTLFFTKPFKRNFERLPDDVLDAFQKDVEKWITLSFKDRARFN